MQQATTSQSAASCGPGTLIYHPPWPELAHLQKGSGCPPRRKYSRLPQAQAAPPGASSPGTPASSRAAERGAGLPPLSGASDYFSTCGRNRRKLKSHGERAARGDSALTKSRQRRRNCCHGWVVRGEGEGSQRESGPRTTCWVSHEGGRIFYGLPAMLNKVPPAFSP